jgi:hypothetical protein
MKLQEHIRKVLKEELNESTFFRRRVDMDLFEKEFYENLNYAIGITLSLRDQGNPTTFSKFKRRVIDYLMDNYHGELSNWGSKEYPYDEVYNFLSDYFYNKIKEKYDEVFGEDINEPLNENKNKFNREDSEKGEYSDLLESLTTYSLGKENICDVFAMYVEGTYAVLVYYNGNVDYYLNEELDKFLTTYVPTNLFSHIINSKCD